MLCHCGPLVAPDGPVTEEQWRSAIDTTDGACRQWNGMRTAIASSGLAPSLRSQVRVTVIREGAEPPALRCSVLPFRNFYFINRRLVAGFDRRSAHAGLSSQVWPLLLGVYDPFSDAATRARQSCAPRH